MSSIDETKKFVPLNIAVLTVSDTRSLADDKSGTTLSERLTAAGHKLAGREIVVDDADAIRAAGSLRRAASAPPRPIVNRWPAAPGVPVTPPPGAPGSPGRDGPPEAIEP